MNSESIGLLPRSIRLASFIACACLVTCLSADAQSAALGNHVLAETGPHSRTWITSPDTTQRANGAGPRFRNVPPGKAAWSSLGPA